MTQNLKSRSSATTRTMSNDNLRPCRFFRIKDWGFE